MFDPYRKWLGIPPKDQPPNHYRLLSLENFESDPDVIESAADRQMSFIRQYQSGEYATDAAKILNELAVARLCLLKPVTKAAYDEKLRAELSPPPEPEQDFPNLPFGDDESVTKRRPKKSRPSKSAAPQSLLIGGGIAGIVCLLLVVFLFTGKRKPPVDTTSVVPANPSPANTEKPTSVPIVPATTSADVWTDTKLAAEPVDEPIDLLKLVDLARDRVAGTWQQTATALISSSSSSLYLPVNPPEDYQLKFTVRRTEGADSLILGFMMAGRQGMIGFDVGGAVWTGLYVDRREPHENCTTRKGKLFTNEAATIVLTIHPGHLHATVDGKTVVDWHGNSERLFLHGGHGLSSRESPFIAVSQAKYIFESASLIRIKPEPVTPRLARLDHVVNVMPLMDTERDSRRGIWGINKNSLSSPDSTGYSQIYLPTVVPEEYTLSMTAEMPPNVQGDSLVVGLVAGQSYFQFSSTNRDIGLDQIDLKRFHENETRMEGPLLNPGGSVRLDFTVTKSGIRTEVDGKTMIDWRGDVRRLSMPNDWPLVDARRFYIGTMRHFKFRDIKLGPPVAPPKAPEHPPLSVGKPLDLLTLIDPARDAYTGIWERDGNSIRCRGDVQINKLVVPVDVPEEYRLTARVARVEGGKSNSEGLGVGLPIGRGRTSTFVDAYSSRLAIVRADASFEIAKEAGQLIPPGVVKELVYIIRKTGVQLSVDGKTIIDWKINPLAFTADIGWSTPGPRIALESFGCGFRFDKLELEQLPPTDFPNPQSLAEDGDLLPIVNVERDARRGIWKQDATGLTTPKMRAGRLQLPVTVPDRYVLTMDVENKSGRDGLFIGLPMQGHPCMVCIDGVEGKVAALSLVDGADMNEAHNLSRRSYTTPILIPGKRIKVQCLVIPNTVVLTCNDVEVFRWHGDSRRLSLHQWYIPPHSTTEDHAQLWLSSWETEFLIHSLKLQPMSGELAAELESSFNGVYPLTSQADVPLVFNVPAPTPKVNTVVETTPKTSTKPPSKLLPVPERTELEAARTRITKSLAAEYKAAQDLKKKLALAVKLMESAVSFQETAIDRYAYFIEAREIYAGAGDLLAALRTVDTMATSFDLAPFEQKSELLQRFAKKAKNPLQQRFIVFVALKLAGDAAAEEDYATAKEACARAVTASRSASDTKLQAHVVEQSKAIDNLFSQYKSAKLAEEELKANPNNAAAHAKIGEYSCWVRRNWANGLPSLRHTADTRLQPIVAADLANPGTADAQRSLADSWLGYAKVTKSSVIRVAAAERAATWYEKAMPGLSGDNKAKAETEIDTAYELASGRDFKKLLARPPNGVDAPGTFDCKSESHQMTLQTAFDFTKSWMLSLEFNTPNLDGGWHQVFFWGDGAGGDDPLWVRIEGNRLSAVMENIIENRGQGIDFFLPGSAVGQWTDLKFVYDAVSGNLELYINHRLIRRESLAVMPAIDRGMPIFLGGTDATGQRFGGQVRKVWLGNIP